MEQITAGVIPYHQTLLAIVLLQQAGRPLLTKHIVCNMVRGHVAKHFSLRSLSASHKQFTS